jgi:hypothetical protein
MSKQLHLYQTLAPVGIRACTKLSKFFFRQREAPYYHPKHTFHLRHIQFLFATSIEREQKYVEVRYVHTYTHKRIYTYTYSCINLCIRQRKSWPTQRKFIYPNAYHCLILMCSIDKYYAFNHLTLY